MQISNMNPLEKKLNEGLKSNNYGRLYNDHCPDM